MHRSCKCGSPVFIQKTGECAPCYHRRRNAEHRTRALTQLCRRCKRRPATVASTGHCAACTSALRRARQTRVVSYHAAHARVRKLRGSASVWRCIHCGVPAQEWAYRGGSPRERRGVVDEGGKRRRMAWSPDPSDYDPMCRSCHGSADRPEYGKGYRHDLDRARELRREWTRRQYARQTATEAGKAAYRARKRAEAQRRRERQANPDTEIS